MSTVRKMPGGRMDPATLARAANGRPLCRWCGIEVPAKRRSFCSDWCVNEWRLRSDPGYLREQVARRDHGICAKCGIDTNRAYWELKRARGARRLALAADWGLQGLTRRSLWDADHVLPVVEGGGECDLENLRTLCLKCHRQATQALRERLRSNGPNRAN